MSQIKVRDIDGNPLTLMNIRLALGHGDSDSAYDDKFTDFAGNTAWPVVLPSDNGYTLHVNYNNTDVDFHSYSLYIPGKIDAQDILITLVRVPRERALISGYYSNVFLKGESGFLDLCRKLHGQDIKPLLRQSVDMGSNGRRNFLMTFNTAQAAGLPPFNPDDFPNYFDVLKEMLDEYAEYGLYLYGCAFPDNGLFPGWANQTPKQVDHWNKLGDVAQDHSNFWGLELTNEINSKSFNKVDQSKFSPIPGVICSSGSWTDDGGDSLDYPIQWDMVDFHQRRNYSKSVVDACVANFPHREQNGKATGLGESVGFGDKALNGNREDRPRVAKEIAGSARGTAAMLIYHTTHGAFSQLYDETEKECGHEWFGELQGV